MQAIDHAQILAAYLARLTLADVEAIQTANKTWAHAALNYGDHAQDKARAGFYAAVSQAVANLLPHDRANIDKLVRGAL